MVDRFMLQRLSGFFQTKIFLQWLSEMNGNPTIGQSYYNIYFILFNSIIGTTALNSMACNVSGLNCLDLFLCTLFFGCCLFKVTAMLCFLILHNQNTAISLMMYPFGVGKPSTTRTQNALRYPPVFILFILQQH